MAEPDFDHQRNVLWEAVYRLHYDTYYEELLVSRLLGKWSKIDVIIKVFVAVTSSTSAIAGWALWTRPDFKLIWGVISGVGALCAILSSSLSVQSRIKEHTASKENFSRLRNALEIIRHEMALNPDFDVSKTDEQYKSLKEQYNDHLNGEEYDILVTSKLEHSIQTHLNTLIGS